MFSSPLCGHLVLSVSCSLHRSCQMALRSLWRCKVTDAVWQGSAGAMPLFKGHDLNFRAGRRTDTCRVERLQTPPPPPAPRGGQGLSVSVYSIICVDRLWCMCLWSKLKPQSHPHTHTRRPAACLTYTYTLLLYLLYIYCTFTVLSCTCQMRTQLSWNECVSLCLSDVSEVNCLSFCV